MFLHFENDAERRKYGGSAFIEIQYCELPANISSEKDACAKDLSHWNDKSLYVHMDDMNDFYSDYSAIFFNIDLYGINYYSPVLIEQIKTKIEKIKPRDYKKLLRWLQNAASYNGILILGI